VKRKMMRIFLIGMLCGGVVMAAVTLVFAIPANDFHWRMEIYKRGGAAWTMDKNGTSGGSGWLNPFLIRLVKSDRGRRPLR
jgi:hypothetical protein